MNTGVDWKTVLSGVGVAYIASWVLFLLLAPILQKIIGNWKVATVLSYALSWIAMIVFFKVYASYMKKPSSTK